MIAKKIDGCEEYIISGNKVPSRVTIRLVDFSRHIKNIYLANIKF